MIKVGVRYCFDTLGTDSYWKAFDGMMCTVLRPLTEKEADISDVGPMWRIKFEDERGTETDAFDDELYGSKKRKITLMNGYDAVAMLADLNDGGRTDLNDRISSYFDFATVPGRTEFVKVALIEFKSSLAHSAWCYMLHVLNDIDNQGGYYLNTEHLYQEELEKLLEDLAYDCAHGRA